MFGLRTTHQDSAMFSGVNQNPALIICCNSNVHVDYRLNFSPTTKCVGGHNEQSYPDCHNINSLVQPAVVGNILVRDVWYFYCKREWQIFVINSSQYVYQRIIVISAKVDIFDTIAVFYLYNFNTSLYGLIKYFAA